MSIAIALITPTCRENGRTFEMSRTIAAAVRHAADQDLHLIWIIVDEKERKLEQLIDLQNEHVRQALEGRLEVAVYPPLPSKHRQPGPSKAPAHNSARSAGLIAALNEGVEYVAFLNDCNLITYGMGKVLVDVSRQGVGFRARMHEVPDMPVPADGVVKYKDHHDLLRRIPVESGCGALWGAPAKAFGQIQGFDLSYDGERYANDLDCVMRLSRVGINFFTTERAFTIQLRRTKVAEEITTRKDVQQGDRNRKLYNALLRDPKRITPRWVAGEPEPLDDAPLVTATPPVVEEPKPKWKKRAPPIVGGKNPRNVRPAGNAPIDPARAQSQPAPAAPAPAKVTATGGNGGSGSATVLKFTPPPAPPPAGADDFDLSGMSDADSLLDDLEGDLPDVIAGPDGRLTVAGSPSGAELNAKLDELANSGTPTTKA